MAIPSDIAGLKLWLKADAITGLSDGNAVTTWSDSSGQGNDATQAVAGSKPLYKTNIINGNPVVRFDGTDDSLNLGDVAAFDFGTNNFSIFMVGKNTTNLPGFFAKDTDTGDGNGLYIQRQADKFSYWNGSAYITITMDSEYHLFGIVRSGTGANQLELRLDGGSATTGTDARTLSNASNATIGAFSNLMFPLNGDIAEVIIYDSALSAADRQRIEWYLAQKYAISGPTNPDSALLYRRRRR